MVSGPSPNRLIHEKSPYLLQHAANPVDWYPWGDEAFAEARRRDKPIFLSIGYSTCHWCHVMAHESFEDPEVAGLMNRYFVNVKVDREERPDIDKIYMDVCQMMTGHGGWPLTVIMSADRKPFYAATYIPKQSRFGRIGMMELLPGIHDAWMNRRGEIVRAAEQIVSALRPDPSATRKTEPGPEVLDAAFVELEHLFDPVNGGFGGRPKFPTPQNILFLLRYWKRTGNRQALHMAEKTLQAMRRGGIYDHIGFGFHRYSVDEHWHVPHFEKMLYDQALLVYAYTEAFQATGRPLYAATVEEVLSYVATRMTSPDGPFYSAEDADSEGEEGRFYLWTWEEIRTILDRSDVEGFMREFNIEKRGNYDDELTGNRTGKNIPCLSPPADERDRDPGGDPDAGRRRERARRALWAVRQRRVPPHKDDKILTDWNGLMIAALAKAGRCLNNGTYIKAAEKAAAFIMGRMRRTDGTLLHRFRDGEAGIAGSIDDYAFFTFALIELYGATWDPSYLEMALALTAQLIDRFRDRWHGGFFFTPDNGEEILVRLKEIAEGAMPSGNAVALWNMLRLGRMTARTSLLDEAWDAASSFFDDVRLAPGGYAHFMVALDFAFGPSREVVVAGDKDEPGTLALLHALESRFLPHSVVILRPDGEECPPICRIAPFTEKMKSIEGRATAYVCSGNACRPPTTDTGTMMGWMED